VRDFWATPAGTGEFFHEHRFSYFKSLLTRRYLTLLRVNTQTAQKKKTPGVELITDEVLPLCLKNQNFSILIGF